jgi:hypothetical protein
VPGSIEHCMRRTLRPIVIDFRHRVHVAFIRRFSPHSRGGHVI